ncbi:MAG: isoprenylcysteine carboxylmethyltransferase family protein [Silvanigrellales bacterium]|nr:isoprenylcysteine carboxylmethyltransferase family protein [Silvanigrellales bacterium]
MSHTPANPTGAHPAGAFDALKLSPLQKAGEVLFRLRDYTPIPIILLALLYAKPTLASIVGGLLVALFGECARAYGVAFIGSISRTRSYSNGELVKEGPFALLRNPLYFGNLVLSVGLSVMAGVVWLPAVVVILFYAQYIPIVAWEEMKLTRIFGERYDAYKREVPNRWFPRLAGFLAFEWARTPVVWGPAWKSEKRTLTSVIAFTVVMIALFLFDARSEGALLPLVKNVLP